MKKKNGLGLGYGSFDALLGTGLNFSGIPPFMAKMFALSDERNRKEAKDILGITSVDNFEGSEQLGIPHKYNIIEIKHEHLFAYINEPIEGIGHIDVYTLDGKFLFNGDYIEYKKEGMFLVGKIGEDKNKTLYALYNQERKLTDYLYKSMMDSFNQQGFCCIGVKDYAEYVVVNKEGEIKYTMKSYDTPYIYGVLCTTKDSYINLLTGERICSKGYRSTISTDTEMFIQVDTNSVYQINKTTGEFVVHGEPEKPKPEPIAIDYKTTNGHKRPITKGTEPSPKIQGRNELCACGCGKKFKNCCANKKTE